MNDFQPIIVLFVLDMKQFLVSSFVLDTLLVFSIVHSICYFFWQKFVNMRVLNFDDCEFITEIPDVSGAPNLEELSFGDCKILIKNHESVGFLNKLKMLNADGCSRLVELFSYQIVNLGLSACHVSDDFLRIGLPLPLFSNVKELYLSQNEFSTLPACIKECYFLTKINLDGCKNLKIFRPHT
jgi:hypothetical protein